MSAPSSSVVLEQNVPGILAELKNRFGAAIGITQKTRDGMPTQWVARNSVCDVLRYLKLEAERPYRMLYDLTAIDERTRVHRDDQPASHFTVVYHLLSFERNADIRLKLALSVDDLRVPTITGIWPAANWYEREIWDMFGIVFSGHPHLRRILLPPWWKGHALQKDHPARATEMGPFRLTREKEDAEQEALRFHPEEWGMRRAHEGTDFMFLNLGPNHPGVHGVFRIVLQLDGEEIVDAVPDIGFHHRGAEKMGERQSWHTYIPYTDRVDYLGGVMNNLPYVLAVEKLAGIEVPETTKILIGEVSDVSTKEEFAHEKLSPVLAMYRAKDFDDAIEKADRLVKDGGYGHTTSIYINTLSDNNRLETFQNRMQTARILVNTPAAQGGIGDIYNLYLRFRLYLLFRHVFICCIRLTGL